MSKDDAPVIVHVDPPARLCSAPLWRNQLALLCLRQIAVVLRKHIKAQNER